MQFVQRINRDLCRSCRHRCADRCIAHPLRYLPGNILADFEMENLLIALSQSLANTQAFAVQRMPAIVNHGKLQSVCRMTCDLPASL